MAGPDPEGDPAPYPEPKTMPDETPQTLVPDELPEPERIDHENDVA